MNPINPNHETASSGKTASKHLRNSVFRGRSWVRYSDRKRPRTVERNFHELSTSQKLRHLEVMFSPAPDEREVRTSVEPRHLDLPLDCTGWFESPDREEELRVLIETALSSRVPRYRHETKVRNGILRTVSVEIPHRPIKTLRDFLESFPSCRAAVKRICNLNQ